jgi:hypothetical protein
MAKLKDPVVVLTIYDESSERNNVADAVEYSFWRNLTSGFGKRVATLPKGPLTLCRVAVQNNFCVALSSDRVEVSLQVCSFISGAKLSQNWSRKMAGLEFLLSISRWLQ